MSDQPPGYPVKQPAEVSPYIRELQILNAIAEALNRSTGEQQALESTLGLVADLLGLETGWIWMKNPETGQLYSAATRSMPPYLQAPTRMTGYSCNCIREFNDNELTPKNIDLIECSRLQPAVLQKATDETQGLAYHASIPLYFQDEPLGILNLGFPAWRKLTDEELNLLSIIAYQVGIAVERARLAEKDAQFARVEERARLAREIHDTLAQGLTGIALHLESALYHLSGNPDEAHQRINRALQMTRESIEEARRSVLDLREAPLAGKPLAAALRSLSHEFTSETGIRVHFHTSQERDLPLRIEAELFRIAQEAFSNIGRHSKATEAILKLETGPDQIELVVIDNGIGFDPQQINSNRQGIVGMRERTELLGGKLTIKSKQGERSGTTILAEIPVQDE